MPCFLVVEERLGFVPVGVGRFQGVGKVVAVRNLVAGVVVRDLVVAGILVVVAVVAAAVVVADCYRLC